MDENDLPPVQKDGHRVLKTFFTLLTLTFSSAHPAAAEETRCEGPCAAGYKWAQEHHVTKEKECFHEDEGFVAGCRAFIAETAPPPAQDHGQTYEFDESIDNIVE